MSQAPFIIADNEASVSPKMNNVTFTQQAINEAPRMAIVLPSYVCCHCWAFILTEWLQCSDWVKRKWTGYAER